MKLNPSQKARLQALQSSNTSKGGRYQEDKIKHQIDDLLKLFWYENKEIRLKKEAQRAKHLKRFERNKK